MPTRNAVQYTIGHLLQVAFPDHTPTMELAEGGIAAHINGISIQFPLMGIEPFRNLMKGTLTMDSLPTTIGIEVPAYRCIQQEGNFSISENTVQLHHDLVTMPFVLLSRIEEDWDTAQRDAHGRYLFTNSLAAKYNFIDVPIVDVYALLIRSWVSTSFPQLQVTPRKPRNISTHDIDIISRFGNGTANIRTLAADLFKHHDRKLFHKSLQQLRQCHRDELTDPYVKAAEQMLEQDLAAGWDSLFFFKALRKTDSDFSYDIFGTQAAHLIRTIEGKGGKIGLHGSYDSPTSQSRMTKEKIYLETVTEHPITAGRQHYLRFNRKVTPGIWQAAGLTDDYTLGYAEREGFRCGTCHPYALYDVTNDCPTKITEHPLIAMDGTFLQYQAMGRGEMVQKIRALQRTCAAVEGDFILLWHNIFPDRLQQQQHFETFLEIMNFHL